MKTLQYLKISFYIACSLIFLDAVSSIGAQLQESVTIAQISATKCDPTPADYLGPFYEPDAPVRSSVGKGYRLEGMIKSSADCVPIANARVELWLTGPDGSYDDDHRATVFSNENGAYRFESNVPPGYSGRPPHIHMRLSAKGFETLATQHYPLQGQTIGRFDIVLVPSE
jgi:protocatechuate 3,4-dioxygenase beta subunit